MIRVLQFGMSFNKGGIETFLFNYYKNLDHTKIQFDFVKTGSQKLPYEDEILAMGGRIYEFKACGVKKGYLKNKKQWMELYDKVKPDIVHYNTIALGSLSALKYAKKSGIKKRIVHAHAQANTFIYGTTIKNTLQCLVNKFLVKKYATDLWACSNIAGKSMFFGNYEIIPNAIDTERFSFSKIDRIKIRNEMNLINKIVICNVGNLSEVKNQTFLLDIFLELKKRIPDIALIFLGDGKKREELIKKAEDLKIKNDVYFMGNCTNVEAYLSASDLFVFPSQSEGFGIVLLEAQANGLKCFASDKVIPQEINETGTVTFISLKKPATYWAKQIEKYMPFARLDDQQINKIKEKYDLDHCALALEKMYLEGKNE